MIKEYAALMGKTAFNEELGGRPSEDFVHKQMKTILDDGKLIANIESYLQLEARAEIPASDQSESFSYLDPLVYLFPKTQADINAENGNEPHLKGNEQPSNITLVYINFDIRCTYIIKSEPL
jgi:hypothetical protein